MTLQKCPYHVTFDLDLDLEHIVDAGSSADHRVQVWWRFAQKKFTDGRRTPRIALAHWNELTKRKQAELDVYNY